MRVSSAVGGLMFSAPEMTRTTQRAHTPTPPQELPIGAPARRATSSNVSSVLAASWRPSGVNDTFLDVVFTEIYRPSGETSGLELRLLEQIDGGNHEHEVGRE